MKFFDRFQFLAVMLTATDGSKGAFVCRTTEIFDGEFGLGFDYEFGGMGPKTKAEIEAWLEDKEIEKVSIIPVWRLKNAD